MHSHGVAAAQLMVYIINLRVEKQQKKNVAGRKSGTSSPHLYKNDSGILICLYFPPNSGNFHVINEFLPIDITK